MTTAANFRRAQEARKALDGLTIETDGLDMAIVDQLTNLMHLAKHHNIDFDGILNIAEMHFNIEQGE